MRELLAYGKNGVIEEKLTLRIRADNSGDIYLPTAWFSPDGTQDCVYDWMVSIDGREPVNYKGGGSSSGKIRVGYGLTPLSTHSVVVEPTVEDYGWLRAFGYKGTNIASSLINIISDKSYKGFALSSKYSWDYYKAYQYYGCTNLINTDEELLPDTLEVIGDFYRYYEYAGCTSLVHSAEEKILKTVKAIGDFYRAYQYQNCTSINRINMRAINWASVGSNYRYNQFEGFSSDKKPADIYIEGWIEEGGDWRLTDTRVKWIYVYKDLVEDYRTKLSSITSSKIKKNGEWDGLEYEFIEYIAIADSTGKIRIPVGWFSTAFTQDCAYDWIVSISWEEPEEISGTWGATYVSVGSGLTEWSEYRVIIKPETISWWWGRAFGFHTTWAQAYIKEIIHDSYKCFASSRTNTGDYYKYWVFMGCTNLINSYEKLPTSVTTVGSYYMKNCYAGCTSLENAFWEVMHKGCTIGSDYRVTEYAGCTAMEVHQWMAWYIWDTYPTNYKDGYLWNAWDNLNLYITRLERMYTVNYSEISGYSSGTSTVDTITKKGHYVFTGTLVGISWNTSFYVALYQNNTKVWNDYIGESWSRAIQVEMDCEVGDVIQIRADGYQYAWRIDSVRLDYGSVIGLEDEDVSGVYVYVDNLYDYASSKAWSCISDDKFMIYYYDYQPHPTVDITKYTTLVGEWDIPYISNTDNYSFQPWWFGYVRWVAPFSRDSYDVRIPWEYSNLGSGRVYGAIYNMRWKWVSGSELQYLGSYVGTWGWSDIDGNVRGFNIDYKGSLTYAHVTEHSGEWRREIVWRVNVLLRWQSLWDWDSMIGASRDGRYMRWLWKRYYAPTRWGEATVQYGTYSGDYTDGDFSEDGMTAYVSSNFGKIVQYNLKAPRDLNNMVATWKELNISWNWAFSKDLKYLYVYNGKLKVYEYQE